MSVCSPDISSITRQKTVMKKPILLLLVCLWMIGCASSEQQHAEHHSSTAPTEKAKLIPAYFKDAASIPKPLLPTLSPDNFSNEEVKQAYRVAKEIPETLAQLPCYCFCDRSFGHESLHSCYESDHSSGCSTCMDEAMLAYKLQKEQGMKPDQIRNIVMEKFGEH